MPLMKVGNDETLTYTWGTLLSTHFSPGRVSGFTETNEAMPTYREKQQNFRNILDLCKYLRAGFCYFAFILRTWTGLLESAKEKSGPPLSPGAAAAGSPLSVLNKVQTCWGSKLLHVLLHLSWGTRVDWKNGKRGPWIWFIKLSYWLLFWG